MVLLGGLNPRRLVKSIGQLGKSIYKVVTKPARKDTYSSATPLQYVTPVGAASVGAKVLSGASSIAKSISQAVGSGVIKKAFLPGGLNPKNLAKLGAYGTGAGTVIYGVGQGVSELVKSDAPDIVKAAGVGAGAAVAPASAITGYLTGTGSNIAKSGKEVVKNLFGLGQSRIEDATNIFSGKQLPTSPMSYPNMPQDININYSLPDIAPLQNQVPQTFVIESPQSPQFGYTSPNLTIGGGLGGIGENLPLLLLLLAGGAGLGGYALGKKKKKKKKKRKRYKKDDDY